MYSLSTTSTDFCLWQSLYIPPLFCLSNPSVHRRLSLPVYNAVCSTEFARYSSISKLRVGLNLIYSSTNSRRQKFATLTRDQTRLDQNRWPSSACSTTSTRRERTWVWCAVRRATRWLHCTTSCRWRCCWSTFRWRRLTTSLPDVVENTPPTLSPSAALSESYSSSYVSYGAQCAVFVELP